MSKLRVAFSDFWKDFDPRKNFFAEALSTQFDWEISDQPDLLICSVFGRDWTAYSCPRVLFTGENIQSDPTLFDASFTFEPFSKTNYYLPLYRFYGAYAAAFKPRLLTREVWEQKKTIATVFSNTKQRLRNQVYFRLAERFKADSGGRAFNNVGGPVPDKAEFIKNYKFSLAFENTSWPGYTTEKLVEAYSYGTVPIYWGDPNVATSFNAKAFLRLKSLRELGELETTLASTLNDFHRYKLIYEQPLFPENQEPEFLKAEAVGSFLRQVVEGGGRKGVRRRVSNFRNYLWEKRWKTKESTFFRTMGVRPVLSFLFAASYPFFLVKG
ncbi:MAG: hypothetical protein HKM06_05285 [Spirochaetales bacterium]|nr:hypothetical protein [Spirochaetales bacterium]